ncbi:hypothetical protein JHW43_007944 [Diplocarpon mali]|nr:hypothetical protein JHW43_007944 [Diplocarpon mali]
MLRKGGTSTQVVLDTAAWYCGQAEDAPCQTGQLRGFYILSAFKSQGQWQVAKKGRPDVESSPLLPSLPTLPLGIFFTGRKVSIDGKEMMAHAGPFCRCAVPPRASTSAARDHSHPLTRFMSSGGISTRTARSMPPRALAALDHRSCLEHPVVKLRTLIMTQLDTLDILVLGVLLLGTVAYFTKGTYWGVVKDPYATSYANANGTKPGKTRNIVEKMEESNKNCVVFYGSQTGTAEDYASRLAKEGKSRFGLETMVADLEDYDYENLDTLPEDKIVMFVLATYGEGEPTDNAVDFYEFITGEDVAFSNAADPPLQNLSFVAFGLGNNTYEHYNSMVRNVTKALEKLGATKIGAAGEGDDGAGTMEEDFLAWKDPMWTDLAEKFGLEEREAVYEPVFAVTEREGLTKESPEVYLGEPNKMHLEGTSKGPYNAHNPYIAPITESRELFTVKDRNCLHMEIDISKSNLSYETGDHIAIWPTNAGKEVDRFLNILGLKPKADSVIGVKALDPTAKVPFPTPTTYDAIVRYHMEICAPVSRQFIATLAPFAPTEDAKAEMSKLGSDRDYFHQKISKKYLNIAQALQSVSSAPWTAIPFSAFIEGVNKVQPRYYSISSSSLVQKNVISITAVVESVEVPGREDALKGVTTNYLLALKQKQHGDPSPDPHGQTYDITGPRNKYDGVHVPVHVRHSNFKLPSDPSKPVIMVGPGTGVAPFRAFVQERAAQAKAGEDVGRTLLFFGCRKQTEDFMYSSEWDEYKEALGDKFSLVTAFSRDGPKKVYVQHRLQEHAKEVNELLLQKAYFYVCGDAANMAREVNTALAKIMAEQRGIAESKAEEIVKAMRLPSRYLFRPLAPDHIPLLLPTQLHHVIPSRVSVPHSSEAGGHRLCFNLFPWALEPQSFWFASSARCCELSVGLCGADGSMKRAWRGVAALQDGVASNLDIPGFYVLVHLVIVLVTLVLAAGF